MPDFDWSVFSSIMSSITAVVAIVAPVITSIITIKSQERMQKNELYLPKVYEALANMAKTYASLHRHSTASDDDGKNKEYLDALDRYHEFAAASYVVMSLLPGECIQQQISSLVRSLDTHCSPTRDEDTMFYQLMDDINDYLRTSKIKKEKRCAKDKV